MQRTSSALSGVAVHELIHFWERAASTSHATYPRFRLDDKALDAFHQQRGFDRMAGIAGVLPPHLDHLMRLVHVRDRRRRGVKPGSVETEHLCSELRRALLVGLVSRIKTIMMLGGSFLAHAAPVTQLQLLVGSNDGAPQLKPKTRNGRQGRSSPPCENPHTHSTRQSVSGRVARDLARHIRIAQGDYIFDDLANPLMDYSQLQTLRWDLVKQATLAWGCSLPDPGHSHYVSGS
jgi:hypothetical protein